MPGMSTMSKSRWLNRLLPPLLAVLFVLYFGFHATYGDRGLLAHQTLVEKTAAREAALERLQQRQAVIERRVELIRGPVIDADILEEQARRVLGWSRPGEIVVIQRER